MNGAPVPPETTCGELNFIDLFAGAGGLSEGFMQAGFHPIAHVEMNAFAAQTLVTRRAYYALKQTGRLSDYYDYLRGRITRADMLEKVPEQIPDTVLCEMMSDKTLPRICKKIDAIMKKRGIKKVDVMVGGPPCQAYSLVGRAQSNHMDVPMEQDPRNKLYILYGRMLKTYKPRMFVFENVMGIESANGGRTWKNLKKYFRHIGYEIDCGAQNAKNFGVLQNRQRMILIGWLKDSGLTYPSFPPVEAQAVVNDLFADLPALTPGRGAAEYSETPASDYVTAHGIRTAEDVLTHHQARSNQDRDIEIYKTAIQLWNNGHQRLNYNDLPPHLKTHKNTTSFTDRFKVVEGDEPCCHTILAHLSKDGHYFIHPDLDQHRSITVREAARIQSFPDSYYFEGPRTSQFVQIGNAVPPMMAKGIAAKIAEELRQER